MSDAGADEAAVPGSVHWHRLATEAMSAADIEPDDQRAAAHWRRAAEYERQALARIPKDRQRTREIIQRSAEACEHHAAALERGDGRNWGGARDAE